MADAFSQSLQQLWAAFNGLLWPAFIFAGVALAARGGEGGECQSRLTTAASVVNHSSDIAAKTGIAIAKGADSLTDGARGAWAESTRDHFLSAMSVIRFPPSRARPGGGVPFRVMRPTLALTPDDVESLTQQDFFEVIQADAANGTGAA